MKLVLTQEEEGEGGRELVALPGVQESAAGADGRKEENQQPKKTSRGERTEEGELQESSIKPAEKRDAGVVVVVVVVVVEKRRRSITKRGNKIVHVERASSAVRLFPSTTRTTATTITTTITSNISIDCCSIAADS